MEQTEELIAVLAPNLQFARFFCFCFCFCFPSKLFLPFKTLFVLCLGQGALFFEMNRASCPASDRCRCRFRCRVSENKNENPFSVVRNDTNELCEKWRDRKTECLFVFEWLSYERRRMDKWERGNEYVCAAI